MSGGELIGRCGSGFGRGGVEGGGVEESRIETAGQGVQNLFDLGSGHEDEDEERKDGAVDEVVEVANLGGEGQAVDSDEVDHTEDVDGGGAEGEPGVEDHGSPAGVFSLPAPIDREKKEDGLSGADGMFGDEPAGPLDGEVA